VVGVRANEMDVETNLWYADYQYCSTYIAREADNKKTVEPVETPDEHNK
jgi:hypothetical protein